MRGNERESGRGRERAKNLRCQAPFRPLAVSPFQLVTRNSAGSYNMSPGILGRKIGMTQLFRPDGQVVPVTLLKAGPCMVVQRKTPTSDGYDAVQIGLMEFIKPARINKPQTGHLKKAGA